MIRIIFAAAILAISFATSADPTDYTSEDMDYTDYSITIGDRINGVRDVQCTGGCSIDGFFPGVVEICDANGVCENFTGPVRESRPRPDSGNDNDNDSGNESGDDSSSESSGG